MSELGSAEFPIPKTVTRPTREAITAKVAAAERNVSSVRLAIIVFGLVVYTFIMDHTGTIEWLAYATLGVSLVYSTYFHFAKPYERFPLMTSSYFGSISDVALITIWLYATGGIASPFYVILYASLISVAFRYTFRETVIATFFYAGSYLVLLLALGQVSGNLTDVLIRVAYVFFVGALGAMFAREAMHEIAAKLEMRDLARALEVETTQRKLAEQTIARYADELESRIETRTAELRQAKEQVEAILNNSSDAIIVASPDGSILQTNPAFQSLLGYERGAPLKALVEPEYANMLTQALRTVTETNLSCRIEVVALSKTNVPFNADIALAPVAESGAAAAGVICSLRDITERKQLEKELRAALASERELNELKSRFTSMVTHEFRTPLAVILTTSDLLRRHYHRFTDEHRKRHFEDIRHQVRRLTTLLDDVLALGKAEVVGVEIERAPINLIDFCAELSAEMQRTTETHTIEFSVTGEPTIAMIDARLMHQAISNLISNAVKYSPHGSSIQFRLTLAALEACIAVEDHGIGIPPEDHERLFEVFHRARNVGAISGSGLGLAIVKQAVTAHNGTISFTSSEGNGTTFTVCLPLSSE